MKKRINGKTPHGGDYSESIYLNNNGVEVNEREAAMFSIIEYKNDGRLFSISADSLILRNTTNETRSSRGLGGAEQTLYNKRV